MYTVGYDETSGLVTTLTNEQTKLTTPFKIDWGFYKSSEGARSLIAFCLRTTNCCAVDSRVFLVLLCSFVFHVSSVGW